VKGNNYTRGNIYRDKKSLEFSLSQQFRDNQKVYGSEAFIIAVSKQEEEQGLFLSDLVYFGISGNEIFCFGIDQFICRIPFDKLDVFTFKEFENINYFFPPQIPPKRAGLFDIAWRHSDEQQRRIIVMFPAPALFPFEMEYSSHLVHKELAKANTKHKFYTKDESEDLLYFLQYLPTVGIPNEVNTEDCTLDEELGYY